jgi:hypothetical protein
VRTEAATRILDIYRRRLDYGKASAESATSMQTQADTERGLRLAALRAERDELYRLRRAREIDDDVHRRLVREIDLMEASLARASAH